MMKSTPSACIEATGEIAKIVLMPGDPLRAKVVAETYLTDAKLFNTVRNMLGYTGLYKGKKVSVMGSGMGVASMGLYAFELYNFLDVEGIIRIGSAGGLAEETKVRDLVIAMGASTNSGYVNQYGFPGQLTPLASWSMLRDAVRFAEQRSASVKVGQVFTSDQFYNAQKDANQRFREMGMLAVEMETAGLYWTAMAAGKQALSILTISDHIFTGEALSADEREKSFTEMMEIALETAYAALSVSC